MSEKTLAQRIEILESAIAKEREDKAALQQKIDRETLERTEALLWQEHRLYSAWRNVFVYRKKDRDLWLAAVGGLGGALLGRSGTAAALGTGFLALMATIGLSLHTNYLLAVQSEKMDVQTIITDAQRRTQYFQAEFAALSGEIATLLAEIRKDKLEAGKPLKEVLEATASIFEPRLPEWEIEELASTIAELKSALRELRPEDDVAMWDLVRVLSEFFTNLGLRAQNTDEQKNDFFAAGYVLMEAQRNYEHKAGDRWNLRISTAGAFLSLDDFTSARVSGLSRFVKPYPTLNAVMVTRPPQSEKLWERAWAFLSAGFRSDPMAVLEPQSWSAERGQLLTFLLKQGVDGAELDAADFSFADLSARVIGPANIPRVHGANFSWSDLRRVEMLGDISGASLKCTRIRGGNFVHAKVRNASFAYATIGQYNDVPSRFSLSAFAEADFTGAEFFAVEVHHKKAHELARDAEEITLGELFRRAYPDRPPLEHMLDGVRLRKEGSKFVTKWPSEVSSNLECATPLPPDTRR